jgi:osmotically-inducible protein OsmY
MEIFEPTKPCHSPDDLLATRVKLNLTNWRDDFRSVRVLARHETVRLSGVICSAGLRSMAVGLAQRVAGVRHVQDHLKLAPQNSGRQVPSSPGGIRMAR